MPATKSAAPVADAAPQADLQSFVSKPNLPEVEFSDINVAWSGDLGAALERAMQDQKAAASEEGAHAAAKPDASAQVVDQAPVVELNRANPAALETEPSARTEPTPEPSAEFDLESLSEDDFSKILESTTARRLLGPKTQSERDKAYARGYDAARQAIEQEIALAREAKSIEFSDESRTKAQQAIMASRQSAFNQALVHFSENVASLIESLGGDPEHATLNGKQFKSTLDYLEQALKPTIDTLVADRVKREAAKQAKTLAAATVAKKAEEKISGLPKTPDFIPSGARAGDNDLSSWSGVVKAYNAGEISTSEFGRLRHKFGVD